MEATELRRRVHGDPRSLVAVGRRWDELLHPRGKDGRFIHKGGFVSGLFRWFSDSKGNLGQSPSQRAEVVRFTPGSNDRVLAWVQDVNRPGEIGMADVSEIVEVASPKARMSGLAVGRDGLPIEVGQKVGLIDMPGFRHGQRGSKEVLGEVVAVNDTPNGQVVVQVAMTDDRWDPAKFGQTFDARPDQVAAPGFKKKSPKPAAAPPAPKNDTGAIPQRSVLTGYTPSPDGPNFQPLETPPDWATIEPAERLTWLKKQMEADFSQWRGEPTVIDFTGYDSGIAFNLANTYRDLANWDPDTARRIDKFIPGHMDSGGGLGPSAIAVAHPGTAHPGGIGPKIKESAIVFKESYFKNMSKWKKDTSPTPWSMSGVTGDPTLTLVHEFAHQRQFRFLAVAMGEVGEAWSPVVMPDGFGLIPDSSNWPETQKLRYDIPKLAPTTYGQSKSSEGFAEAWAARSVGYASPQLISTLDEWDSYMGLALMLPKKRHPKTRSYDELTEKERNSFWLQVGGFLALPGMRKHYPESAKAYDQWVAAEGVVDDVVEVVV